MATPLLDLANADKTATAATQDRAAKELQRVQVLAAGVPDATKKIDDELTAWSIKERAVLAELGAATTQAERDEIGGRRQGIEIEVRCLTAHRAAWALDAGLWHGQSSALEKEAQRTKDEATAAAKEADTQAKAVDQTPPEPGKPPRPVNRADVVKLLDVSDVAQQASAQDALAATAKACAYQGIPDPFAKRIQDRAARRRDASAADGRIVADLDKAEDDLRLANGGPSAATDAARVAFEAADAAARDVALRGQARLASIVASLTAVAASPELPDADAAKLAAAFPTDAAAPKPTEDALKLEQALDAARTAREGKDAALETAWRKAVAKAPDKDPAEDPGVKKAQGELDTADNDVTAAETAYTDADRQLVDVQEATIPDARWQVIQQYEDAQQALADLKKVDVTELKKTLETTEKDLATAIGAQRKVERTMALLAFRRAYRAAAVDAAVPVNDSGTFTAIRGDG